MAALNTSLSNSKDWDSWWRTVSDFHLCHPGARHRRRLILHYLSILFQLSHSKPLKLLDVGCGDGLLLKEVQRRFSDQADLYGVDSSPCAIEAAENKLSSRKEFFTLLDIEEGSLKDQFDIIVCSEVIEHLSLRQKAVSNLTAMLKPGGHLILTTPQGRIFPTEKYFGHKTHSSKEEFLDLARQNNLQLKEFLAWGFPAYNLIKVLTNIRPEQSIKTFGTVKYSPVKKALCHILYLASYLNLPAPAGYQLIGVFHKKTA